MVRVCSPGDAVEPQDRRARSCAPGFSPISARRGSPGSRAPGRIPKARPPRRPGPARSGRSARPRPIGRGAGPGSAGATASAAWPAAPRRAAATSDWNSSGDRTRSSVPGDKILRDVLRRDTDADHVGVRRRREGQRHHRRQQETDSARDPASTRWPASKVMADDMLGRWIMVDRDSRASSRGRGRIRRAGIHVRPSVELLNGSSDAEPAIGDGMKSIVEGTRTRIAVESSDPTIAGRSIDESPRTWPPRGSILGRERRLRPIQQPLDQQSQERQGRPHERRLQAEPASRSAARARRPAG